MVEIGNEIVISHPPQSILNYCDNELVLGNPDYFKKERMGLWTGNIPREIALYSVHGDTIHIPYGCKKQIVKLAKESGLTVTWGDYKDISEFRAAYNSTIKLYEYQSRVVEEMLKTHHGIVVMPCGSGKTQTALEAIARLGLKTLWLTHTQDLLNQSRERARGCYECAPDMLGSITEGKINISKGITFATVQTMCKIDLESYRKEWAVIVVDECQHCCGSPTRVTQFYKVVNSLYAPYKFGLTATPDRTDGLEKSMYALLGDIIIEIDKNEVRDRTCPVKVQTVETGYCPDPDVVTNGDGTINYTALIQDLIDDKERLQIVSSLINTQYTMVLANRIKYLEALQKEYKGKSVLISTLGTSKKAKAERKEVLRKLNDGEIDCVFATYQLAAEGLDCPNLRYVVFATPEKNERTVSQAVGRVARKADGKECGTVIDFVDSFGMYLGWAKKRRGYYKKLGCNELKT